jgi:Carboxypeptidase regulatory-like domain
VSLGPEPRVAELTASFSLGSRDTDAAGAFAFDGLKAGVYRITAGSAGGPTGSGTAVVKDLVLEEERAARGLELRLQAPARIEGTITGPDGKPCAGAVVFLSEDAGSRLAEGYPPPRSDAGGRFSIDGLPPGALRIGARTDGLVTAGTPRIELRAGETSRIALELRDGTRLRVLVQEEDGCPVGASLRVADERGQTVGSAQPLPNGDRGTVETPESGLWIGPIPPGRYTITATNHDGASASREIFVAGDEQVVTLRYGS